MYEFFSVSKRKYFLLYTRVSRYGAKYYETEIHVCCGESCLSFCFASNDQFSFLLVLLYMVFLLTTAIYKFNNCKTETWSSIKLLKPTHGISEQIVSNSTQLPKRIQQFLFFLWKTRCIVL